MATAKKAGLPVVSDGKERRKIVGKRRTMSQHDMITLWTSEDFFVSQRKIYLGSAVTDAESNESAVDAAMAKKFEKAMTVLEDFSDKLPIKVYLNTSGGNVYHCLAIYDRIMDSPCHVTVIGTGYVMSAGAIILQAGDKRLLTRNASVLLHYGSPLSGDDHHMNAERTNEENRRLRAIEEDIFLAQMTKKDPAITRAQVRDLLQFDTYMDALKAIRLGLADGLNVRTKHKRTKTVTRIPKQEATDSNPNDSR